MLLNYLKIAWRNISKHRIYSLINVAGLSFGICACMVIFLIVKYEFGFDKFHSDGDRIYRIVGNLQTSLGESEFLNSVNNDVAGFRDEIPGFEAKAGFVSYYGSIGVSNADGTTRKFDNLVPGTRSPASILTWPEYFDIFKYEWLAGDARSMAQPFKVVLTEKRARLYFGDLPVNAMIGKTVIYDDSLQATVSGIIKDWKGNTDFGFTDFLSISSATHSFLRTTIPAEDWSVLRPHNAMAFVRLANDVQPEQINQRFSAYIHDKVKVPAGAKLIMYLQPLHDIHFATSFRRGDDGDDFRKAYRPMLYVLISIALFILLHAIVNFINLATAQSVYRAKEIGVRKVFGSNKKNITIQFLLETFSLTALAALVAVLLVNPTIYLFKEYIPEGIVFNPMNSTTWLFLLAVTIVTTLLAGYYPARVLSRYLPILSLKGTALEQGSDKISLRKALVVFQFTISLVFIIGSIVVSRQIHFMRNADKGFNTDAIITINKFRADKHKLKVFANEIKQIKGIDKVLLQGFPPMGFAKMSGSYTYKGKELLTVQPVLESGNEDYVPFYEMKILAGRNMLPGDTMQELVINETLAKNIGFKDPTEAIGKLFYSTGNQPVMSFPVVGVVADFHQGSFHEAIMPTIIADAQLYHSVAVKLSASEKDVAAVKNILAQIEEKWQQVYPAETMNYNFLNESIGWLYGQDEKTAWLINAATIITIFISCMGLFALSLFTAQKRIKEIGIRKVLGASISIITLLLSKDFLLMVVMALVIATPIAWYALHHWLQDYAYRIRIQWWFFVLAGVVALVIAFVTISFQSIKSAITNPAKSLRTE